MLSVDKFELCKKIRQFQWNRFKTSFCFQQIQNSLKFSHMLNLQIKPVTQCCDYTHQPGLWPVVLPAECLQMDQRNSWLVRYCRNDPCGQCDVRSLLCLTACHSWWHARRQKCRDHVPQPTWQPAHALGQTWSLTALPRAHAVHDLCTEHSTRIIKIFTTRTRSQETTVKE